MTPEQRERLERGVERIDGFDPLGSILVMQDDRAAALAEIDKLTDALDHIKVLINHTGWGPLSRLALIGQTVEEVIGRPPRLTPPGDRL